MSIVERIQDEAKKKNISIKALEKEIGLGNGTIKRWDNSSPQCNKILLVANYLHVSIEWLITGNTISELTEQEKQLLEKFNSLSDYDKGIIMGRIELLTEQKQDSEKSSISKIG